MRHGGTGCWVGVVVGLFILASASTTLAQTSVRSRASTDGGNRTVTLDANNPISIT